MSELVSIIVPVYKTEKYLERCIRSIQRQNYISMEIILVDDGSPDGSGNLCDELAKMDDRIRVIHKTNGGMSSARNAGIEVATGDYICFVDSDDYIEKDYVSTLYRLISENDADLAKINYIEIDKDDYSENSGISDVQLYEGKEVEEAFLKLRVDSACVFMYRRILIDDTRFPEGKTSEDIPFNFQLFQKARRFVYCPVNKYYYWHNPESISNGPLDKNMLNYLYFREDIYKSYSTGGNEKLMRMAEVLYARAAMGLMARMALYGIRPELSEAESKKLFKTIFESHAKAFYLDRDTALNRKLLSLLVFNFYPVAKLLGRFAK